MAKKLLLSNSFFFLLLLGLSIALTNPAATQSILFVDSGQTFGTNWKADVELGDLDRDGDLDGFFVSRGTGNNEIWLNQGELQGGIPGVFQLSGPTLGNNAAEDVALGDLDGDTDLDAFIITNDSLDPQQVWINLGGEQGGTAGIFQRNSHTSTAPVGRSITLGDVDRDGDLDAYITNIFNPDQLFLNDGGGNFNDSGRVLEGGESEEAAFADLDGDGDLDIFVATRQANKVWINQDGAQNGVPGTFLDSGQSLGNDLSLSLAVGDVDGDSDLDIFVGNTLGNKVWLNQGGNQAGSFADSGQNLGFASTLDVDLGDLDGDGDLDAFVANAGENHVWINQGGIQGGSPGIFSDLGQPLDESYTESAALGDVDGDSDLDVIMAGQDPSNRLLFNQTSSGYAANWQFQTLDVRGNVGQDAAVALDQFGHPHISYYEQTQFGGRLKYAWWDGVNWHSEIVDESAHVGLYSAIALDPNGRPHISYHDITNRDLKYATKSGGNWTIQVVESGGDIGRFTDIAYDTRPHISYMTGSGLLKYAKWGVTRWTIQDVAQTGSINAQSLALNSDGLPHISYFDGELRFASWNGVAWTTTDIDNIPGIGTVSALAFDGQDRPHIAYFDPLNNWIRHAEFNGTGWATGVVTQNAIGGKFLDLAVDNQDRPHVVYIHAGRLQFARGTTPGGWQIETIDGQGPFEFASISWSVLDKPHIVYFDKQYRDLKYVHDGPEWQLRPLQTGGIDRLPDIAMRQNKPIIALRSAVGSPPQILLTQWQNQSWLQQSVTYTVQLDFEVALAYDKSDQPHLAYYENNQVKYASWRNGQWVEEVIHTLLPNQTIGERIELLWRDAGPVVVYSYSFDGGSGLEIAVPNSAGGWTRSYLGIGGVTNPLTIFAVDVNAVGDIFLAYHHPVGNDLQLARYDGTTFSFTPIINDTAVTAVDLTISQQYRLDGSANPVAITYFDATNQELRFATNLNDLYSTWDDRLVESSLPAVDDLEITLAENLITQPRIAYIHGSNNGIFLQEAGSNLYSWQKSAALPAGGQPRSGLSLAVGDRERIAFLENSAVFHLFRSENQLTAPIDDTSYSFTPQELGRAAICVYILFGFDYCTLFPSSDLCAGLNLVNQSSAGFDLKSHDASAAPLTGDAAVMADLTLLFKGTADGNLFLNTFVQHEKEITTILLGDPVLVWDGYRTLQDFMPGLEALTQGRGAEERLTQEMIDNAYSVWSRIAAEGSPELAAAIAAELAKSNNLQDFVGQTYDQWAVAIGLDPPSEQIYLPIVGR